MSITLTNNAVAHLQKSLKGKQGVLGVRIGIKASGCSGFAYVLDFANEINHNDEIFKGSDIQIVVDKQSLKYLKGTQIDCVTEGLNEYLKFNNPNVKNACGCGESFNIED